MRWLIVLGVVLMAALVGAWVFVLRAPKQADVELVAITTAYPGASPLVVEREVSEPLEAAVAVVPGVVEVRSESREGVSMVLVTVRRDGVDGFVIASKVREALQPKLDTLPRDVSPPMVNRALTPQRTTHHRYVVRSSEHSIIELSSWVEDVLRRELERQQGVRNVERCGLVEQVVEVRPDLQRLVALGLSPLDVQRALDVASVSMSGVQLTIRAAGELKSLDDLSNVPLNEQARLRDVATVTLAAARPSCRAMTHGMNVVLIDATSEGPLEKQLTLPQLPPGIQLEEVRPTSAAFYAIEGEAALGALSKLGLALQRDEGAVEVLLDGAVANDVTEPGIALIRHEGDTLVRLCGLDLQVLDSQADTVREKLAVMLPKFTVGARAREQKPELSVTPSERSPEVMALIALAMSDRPIGVLSQGAQRVDVRLKVASPERASDVMDVFRELRLKDGRPLDSLVKVELREAPRTVLRVNRQRCVELYTSAPTSDVQPALATIPLASGVVVTIAP